MGADRIPLAVTAVTRRKVTLVATHGQAGVGQMKFGAWFKSPSPLQAPVPTRISGSASARRLSERWHCVVGLKSPHRVTLYLAKLKCVTCKSLLIKTLMAFSGNLMTGQSFCC